MASYIGNKPVAGEFKRLDSIAGQFNGVLTSFSLNFNSVSVSAGDASQLIVSLDGVVQEPLAAYTLGVGGSTIVFGSAPVAGSTCHIVQLGGVGGTITGTLTDNIVTTTKIGAGAVTSDRITIDGDISFPDGIKAKFGTGNDLTIFSSGSHSFITHGTSSDGDLKILGENVEIGNSGAVRNFKAFSGAQTVLYYNGNTRLTTGLNGVDVTGTLNASSNLGIAGATATSAILSIPGGDTTTKPQIRFISGIATNLADAAISTTDDSGGTNVLIGSNLYYSNAALARFDTTRSGSGVDFGYTGNMKFYTGSGNNAPTERMRLGSSGDVSFYEDNGGTPQVGMHWDYNDGRLGIGIDSPDHVLDLGKTSGDVAIRIKSTSAGDPTLLFDSAIPNRNAVIRFLDQGSYVAGRIQYVHNGDRLDFQAGSSTGATMSVVNGKVGIGTDSPTATLDVAGTTLVENAKLKANATDISDTAVDVFVYDTRKDSDGGAWRHRTQNTSWYNETLNTSTRGSRKEFPCVAVIVAESNEVTIYDGDDPDMSMWMVFNVANNTWLKHSGSGGCKAVVARDGIMVTGGDIRGSIVRFIADDGNVFESAHNYEHDSIVTRNTSGVGPSIGPIRIAHNNVSDVAITVLPNAPIDPDTGLPVPTIAVATDAGISIIKDSGEVVDISIGAGSYNIIKKVDVSPDGYVAWRHSDTRSAKSAPIPEADKSYGFWTYGQDADNDAYNFYESHAYATNLGNIPALVSVGGGLNDHIFGKVVSGSDGLTLIGLQKSEPAGVYGDVDMPLTAYVTSNYNTGWMNTNTVLATLSDTDTTNAVGVEILTNTNFTSGTSPWVAVQATISAGSNKLTITPNSGVNGGVYHAITTVPGKTYVYQLKVLADASNFARMFAGTSNDITSANKSDLASKFSLGNGTHSITFVATGTTTYIWIEVGGGTQQATEFDDATVRLAEEDRSWNGNGFQVFGTVPKTPVAPGAELVAYGPFTSSNYLQQPYNTDLDFGTGDFMYSMWIYRNSLPTTTHERWFGTAATSTDERIDIFSNHATDNIAFYARDNNVVVGDVRITSIGIGVWHCFHFTRQGRVYKIYHNGELRGTNVGSTTLANYQGASGNRRTHIGAAEHWDSGQAVLDGKIALAKISGTVPSPEQIKKMYNDEKYLFQENAKATLYGTSNNALAIAYDDDTELLHVGTSAGRSVFQGLSRVDNTTDAVGAAISASNGLVAED